MNSSPFAPDTGPHDPGLDTSEANGLARAVRGGDRDALGPWYEAEYPAVHRLCVGFLRRRSEADDVAQDAMLRILDKINHWDPSRHYTAWRTKVVLNVCRDQQRSANRRADHEEEVARRQTEIGADALLEQPSQSASSSELKDWLDRSLALLSPREREAFVLIDLEGFTSVQVAKQVDLSPSTVRASLAMARGKLRKFLAPYEPNLGSGTGESL